MSELDDILDEVESDVESEVEEPPKKKRKTNSGKSSKKSSKVEKEVEMEEEPMTDEDKQLDLLRRKELKLILLKHPDLDTKNVMDLTSQIATMSSEEVVIRLESAKIEIGLRSPMSSVETVVGLVGLAFQRFWKIPDLYNRLMNDTQLLVAVDNTMPQIGENVAGPLQILVRLLGHVSDVQYNQSNFSASPIINTPVIPSEK